MATQSPDADRRIAASPPTVAELFFGFLKLGLTSFGGVLPLARRMIVQQRRWLDEQEFAEMLGLCHFLPGGNIINLSVAIGLEFRGVAGAVAGLLGLVAAPTAVVITLGLFYAQFRTDPRVAQMFAGLAAAAAGLLIATAWKMLSPLLGRPLLVGVSAACFAAIALARVPLLPTMLVLAPVSILLTWLTRR